MWLMLSDAFLSIVNKDCVGIPTDAGRSFRRDAGRHSDAPDAIPTRSRTPFRREAGRRSDVMPDGYRGVTWAA